MYPLIDRVAGKKANYEWLPAALATVLTYVRPLVMCVSAIGFARLICLERFYLYVLIDLETFLYTLDKRYEKKVSKEGGTVAKKIWYIGSPSTSTPPAGAPQWTVKQSKNNIQIEAHLPPFKVCTNIGGHCRYSAYPYQ